MLQHTVRLMTARDPFELGHARAVAGRPLPEDSELESDWGLSVAERRQFRLGYLQGRCGDALSGDPDQIQKAYRGDG